MTNREDTLHSETDIQQWLITKVAARLHTDPSQIDVDLLFGDFGLDSTEALVLAGELEAWAGLELPTTALWYHPTIRELATFIAKDLLEKH